MLARLLALILCLMPVWAQGACAPFDARPDLSAAQRQELQARVDAAPFARGNHWRATRDGQTIHLIGTIHLPDPRLDAISARLAPVIRNADLLMVEVTAQGQARLERDLATRPEIAFLTTGPTLIDMLAPEVWARVSAAAQARGIPGFVAAKFQPWYLALVLAIPPCATTAIATGAQGLDFMLIDIADDAGVPTAALEDHDAAIRLLAADPIERQIEFLALQVFDTALTEQAVGTLMAQYFDQHHVGAIELSRVLGRDMVDLPPDTHDALFDDFLDTLLVQRNHAWMDRIDAVTAQTMVIAAGAGHLGGDEGLLALLHARGFALARLPF